MSSPPDIVLRGGLVHDGWGGVPRAADLLISGDRIVAVGSGLADGRTGADGPTETLAGLAIDVSGLHVAPGFVDMHSHSDTAVIADPLNTAKTRQGITTELIGQDGLGVAPFDPGRDEAWRSTLLGLTGHADLPWTWRSFEDHLAAIEAARPATNVGALLAYGSIRNAVIGMVDRPPSPPELDRMAGLIDEAMGAGAFGMSVGLVYPPALYAATDELIRAFSVVGRHSRLMVIHLRSQGDAWREAVAEAITIAREADVHLHVSHVCSLGRRNWPKIPLILADLEAARASGLPVSFDQHPYTAASTVLAQVLPPWVTEGGPVRMRERLADRAARDRIRTEIAGRGRAGWENYAGLAGWHEIQVAGTSGQAGGALGRTIGEIAVERGQDPVDVVAEILLAAPGSVAMVLRRLYDDAGITTIMRAPGGSIGTDGVIAPHPHPRLYGSTARVLGHYARDLGGLTLEAAVERLSGAGSRILGLGERETLAVGSYADLVVFDPAAVTDRATYVDPARHPDGIHHVMVNGTFVVRDGVETGARPGRVLRPDA